MVREVKKSDAPGYLKQAEEFLVSAHENLGSGRYNVAGFNAIQSIINANDALTICFLERRASVNHREAVKLHIDVIRVIKDNTQRDTIRKALDMRSTVGYVGKPISRKDAEMLVRRAVLFVEWVRKYVA